MKPWELSREDKFMLKLAAIGYYFVFYVGLPIWAILVFSTLFIDK